LLLQALKQFKNSELSELVVSVSVELIDAKPAVDPRWAEENSFTASNYTTSSILLKQQLEEKRRKHTLFFEMLERSGVLQQVTLFYPISYSSIRSRALLE
jgi:hypothetical protein